MAMQADTMDNKYRMRVKVTVSDTRLSLTLYWHVSLMVAACESM